MLTILDETLKWHFTILLKHVAHRLTMLWSLRNVLSLVIYIIINSAVARIGLLLVIDWLGLILIRCCCIYCPSFFYSYCFKPLLINCGHLSRNLVRLWKSNRLITTLLLRGYTAILSLRTMSRPILLYKLTCKLLKGSFVSLKHIKIWWLILNCWIGWCNT